jgi:predicted RNA-binding Zn-ribbon protein involved in translation (DUF1610 family)
MKELQKEKCPECGTNLNYLTVAKKYDCPFCGRDGHLEDIQFNRRLLTMFGD